MKRLRQLLLAFGLAFAFALGQHAVAQHALTHAVEDLAQDGTSSPATCADHGLYASASSAASATPPAAPFVASVVPAVSTERVAAASLPPRYAFHSRAPPASPA